MEEIAQEKRLLVIESYEYEIDSIDKELSDTFNIHFNSSLNKAFSTAPDFFPHAIFLQLNDSSLQILRNFFEEKGCTYPDVPVVIAVSNNNFALERCARQYNVTYYLIKPFEIDELISALNSAIEYCQQQVEK